MNHLKKTSRGVSIGVYDVPSFQLAETQVVPLDTTSVVKGTLVETNRIFVSRTGQSSYGLPDVGDSLLSYRYFPAEVTATLVGRIAGDSDS